VAIENKGKVNQMFPAELNTGNGNDCIRVPHKRRAPVSSDIGVWRVRCCRSRRKREEGAVMTMIMMRTKARATRARTRYDEFEDFRVAAVNCCVSEPNVCCVLSERKLVAGAPAPSLQFKIAGTREFFDFCRLYFWFRLKFLEIFATNQFPHYWYRKTV
jgi:hypothetical protein